MDTMNDTNTNEQLVQDGAGIISSRSSAPAEPQGATPMQARRWAELHAYETPRQQWHDLHNVSGNIDEDDAPAQPTAPANDATARRAAQDAAQAKQHADLLASRAESATKQLEKMRSDPKSDLYSTDPTKQKKAMQTVRALMAQEEAETEPERRSAMSVQDMRSEYGLHEPDIRIESMKTSWDEGHEMNFFDHAHARGWEPALVQDMMNHYVRAAQGTMGEITPAMIEDFHHTFATRLPKEDRDLLVRFLVDEVRGGQA